MKVVMMAAVLLATMCGCVTSPVAFKSMSAPVPPQGYTVLGSDVTGTSEQVWVFGFGGSASQSQQQGLQVGAGAGKRRRCARWHEYRGAPDLGGVLLHADPSRHWNAGQVQSAPGQVVVRTHIR